MSDLAWAQWWAAPWLYAHDDWKSTYRYAALVELHRSGQVATGMHYGIVPCLPPIPDPALLQLAIASADQLDLGLALIEGICRPAYATALDEHHHLWCNSLSKALPLNIVQPDNDPLGLLRAWIPLLLGSGSDCAFLANVCLICKRSQWRSMTRTAVSTPSGMLLCGV